MGNTSTMQCAGTNGSDSYFGDGTTDSYRFAGYRYDQETGLYYVQARYYSPQLGRFLQPDPIGVAGGRNLYAYTGNDPTNLTDPTGLSPDAPSGEGWVQAWQNGQPLDYGALLSYNPQTGDELLYGADSCHCQVQQNQNAGGDSNSAINDLINATKAELEYANSIVPPAPAPNSAQPPSSSQFWQGVAEIGIGTTGLIAEGAVVIYAGPKALAAAAATEGAEGFMDSAHVTTGIGVIAAAPFALIGDGINRMNGMYDLP